MGEEFEVVREEWEEVCVVKCDRVIEGEDEEVRFLINEFIYII